MTSELFDCFSRRGVKTPCKAHNAFCSYFEVMFTRAYVEFAKEHKDRLFDSFHFDFQDLVSHWKVHSHYFLQPEFYRSRIILDVSK